MKYSQLRVFTHGKKWGPYTESDIARFVAERRVPLDAAIWDGSTFQDVLTVGEWITAYHNGTLPKPIRSRRTKRELELAAERKKFGEEKAAFEMYRKDELSNIDKLKSQIEGGFGAFFSKPSGPEDLKFHGRVLELKGKVSKSDIKGAYKRIIAQCHPDKYTTAHPAIRSLAEHQAKLINEAYAFFKRHYKIE